MEYERKKEIRMTPRFLACDGEDSGQMGLGSTKVRNLLWGMMHLHCKLFIEVEMLSQKISLEFREE